MGGAAFDAWGAEIKQKKMTEILSELSYTPMYYEPKESPLLSLFDCINFDKFNAKTNAIERMNLPKKTKEVLKWFCYRFLKGSGLLLFQCDQSGERSHRKAAPCVGGRWRKWVYRR